MYKFLLSLLLLIILATSLTAAAQDDQADQPVVVDSGDGSTTIQLPPSTQPTEVVVEVESPDEARYDFYISVATLAVLVIILVFQYTGHDKQVIEIIPAPFLPTAYAARDSAFNWLAPYIQRTPTQIDDKVFEALADALGYEVVSKPKG